MADIATLYLKVDSSGVVVASKNLKEFTKAAKKTEDQLEDTTGATGKLNDKTKQQVTTLSSASSGLKTVGRDLQRYSLLLAGAATAVTKFSFDLSSGMGQVQTLIPDTGDKIYELEEAVKSLSIESGKNFADLTEGLYQTVSAFQLTTDTIDIFTQATEAAIAGGARVADSIALSSAVTKAYGDTTAEATQKVFDLAFETVRLGVTTFPELANGIQKATDSAVRLGVSQEELFATFSALTGVIGDASEVATKFRSASASLLNPNKALLGLFEQLANATGETVDSGEDFVRVSGGWQQALDLIVTTAEESGQPLQTYIRRIEGITLASRIAGNSAEKYASDLMDANDATGAANRSYKEVKEGIDAFRQSILESKQQIAVAAKEVGDTLVPRLADLFATVADVVTKFSNMDEGIQNTIINIGALITVLGPVLILLGSIARAIKGIQALGAVSWVGTLTTALGPVGLVLSLSAAVAGFILLNDKISKGVAEQKRYTEGMKQQEQVLLDLPDAMDELGDATSGYVTESGFALEKNKDLLRIYPELIDKVDILTASEEALADAISGVNEARARETLAAQIRDVEGLATSLAVAQEASQKFSNSVDTLGKDLEDLRPDTMSGDPFFGGGLSETETSLQSAMDRLKESEGSVHDFGVSFRNELTLLNEDLAKFGLFAKLDENQQIFFTDLEDSFKKSAEDLKNAIGDIDTTIIPPDGDGLKTWQEWFESITGVAKERFGNSGREAGNAFIDDLEKTITDKEALAGVFGEELDYGKGLEDLISTSEDAILSLLKLRDEEIANSDAFKILDNSIESQTERLREHKQALDAVTFRDFKVEIYSALDAVDTLNEAFGVDPESFDALTEKASILQKAIEEGIDPEGLALSPDKLQEFEDQYDGIQAKISETFQGAQAEAIDFTTFLQTEMFGALIDFTDLAGTSALAISDLGTQLTELSGNFAIDALKSLGESLTNAEDASTSFKRALVEQAQAILDLLPSLFIQAGLQMIAQGDRAMGLGFIAAGLTSSFIGGLTSGAQDKEDAKLENATGNAFNSSGVVPFAKGGSFTNSIVDNPTTFAFANGGALGLMGEAGAEAILPLTRTSSGNLGVEATGAGRGSVVNIKIINNTGADVQTNESQSPDGREIEIIIGQAVNKGIATGNFDKSMNTRYGTKVAGISN